MAQWYYSRRGQQRSGPCSVEQLKQLVARGELDGQDLIWREGLPRWVPIAKVAELAALLAASGAAAAASPPAPAGTPAQGTHVPRSDSNPDLARPAADRPRSTPELPKPVEELPPAAPKAAPEPALEADSRTADAPRAPAPRRTGGLLAVLHGLLPKPVLFGLYGALGALLGVLLLGELFWLLLHPTPRVIEPLALSLPPSLTVYPGGENRLPVKIARQNCQGDVLLEVVNAPKEVRFGVVTIPDKETEGELDVSATEQATPGIHEVQVRAAVPGGEVTQKIRLSINPTPPTLQISVSPVVTVYAGYSNKIIVKMVRRLFDGPVRLEVLDLPKGVNIPLVQLPEGAVEGILPVSVEKGAEPLAHRLLVEARSLKNHTIAVKEPFRLHVEPPPGKLQMTVPPVVVYPGDKNRFTVRIGRRDFNDPVQLEAESLPAGVVLPPVQIPAGATSARMEVSVAKEALAAGPLATDLVRINARALGKEKITASLPLPLKIQPPPPLLQLTVSPRASVYVGGKTRFGVRIARHRFKGPVRIEPQNRAFSLEAKAGRSPLTISSLTLEGDNTEGELEVTVDESALTSPLVVFGRPMDILIQARDLQGKVPVATDRVQFEIKAPPSDLHVSLPEKVETFQGGKFRFKVKVGRAGFAGPVQVEFPNPPSNVFLPTATIPLQLNELEIEGRASVRTEPGEYSVNLQGRGSPAPDGKTPIKAGKFRLVVKPLPPSQQPPPLDIVFVLDITNSMDPQIKGLRDGIGRFVAELKKREIDVRIGLVAFRDITVKTDDEPIKVLQFAGQPFTTDPQVFSAEVGKLRAGGGGDNPDSSLDGLEVAAKLPFRNNAQRVLLLITDEEPQTKGNSVTLAQAQQILRDKKIDQVHLVVDEKKHKKHYEPLHNVAKGRSFDLVAETTRGFADLLPILSKEIAITSAPEPEAVVTRPPPAPPPPPPPPDTPKADAPPPPPEVAVGSPVVPEPPPPGVGEPTSPPAGDPQPPTAAITAPPRVEAPTLQAVQSTQRFAEEDRIPLLIAIALWTAALAAGISLALVAGQKLYLHQTWPGLADLLRALRSGLLAGAIGGVIGQWFFQSTSGAAGWDVISRILAWGILGGLIGGGMSLFVPNLNWQRGFLGGGLGGLIGAVVFALCSLWLTDSVLGRLLGATVVGLCIGVMIALAELAFRRYWLEVTFGEREVRTFTLGPATVAVGSDDRQAAVYVPDAPPKALGYRAVGHRIFCEDFATGKTSQVPPGDQRHLGKVRMRVCSATSASPIGATLQLTQVRDLALMEGMPLTADDIPGLEPQGADGSVALVSRRPNDPKVFLLRNRSKQSWEVTDSAGNKRTVGPGLSIDLTSRCQIDFGQVKATLDPGERGSGG